MIRRIAQNRIEKLLQQFPAVCILGPRQTGKTTLAKSIAKSLEPSPIYLDLEKPSDFAKLHEPEMYLQSNQGRLMIMDEIQRAPGLFQVLRSVIDERRSIGKKTAQFLLLGSASLELLKQSSESLAGRIVYQELTGITVCELLNTNYSMDDLWLRGGFPESLLAESDEVSFEWRQAFIRTYLERDIPQFGARIPAETLRRLWTMLAHCQGTCLNANRLASSLGVSATSIHRYLDLLVDLLLIRRLQPWSRNVGKRLVKSPKIYIRDSGITHALLNLKNQDDLLGHPAVGGSWEGSVIENLLAQLPTNMAAYFYRTSTGAEIDLVIEVDTQRRIAIEIKHSLSPTVSQGFYNACEDIKATHQYVVYPGKDQFNLSKDVKVVSVLFMAEKIMELISH